MYVKFLKMVADAISTAKYHSNRLHYYNIFYWNNNHNNLYYKSTQEGYRYMRETIRQFEYHKVKSCSLSPYLSQKGIREKIP